MVPQHGFLTFVKGVLKYGPLDVLGCKVVVKGPPVKGPMLRDRETTLSPKP